MGLRRVLEHGQAVARGDGQDGLHVGRVAVEVDRQDHLRARRDRGLERPRVHGEGGLVHVDEDRPRPVQQDRLAGGDEGVGDGDHLVAGPDAVGAQRDRQRVGAVRDADGVARPAESRELLLEEPALVAADEVGAGHDAGDAGVDLRLDPQVLGAQVDHRHVVVIRAAVYLPDAEATKRA